MSIFYEVIKYKLGSEGNHLFVKTFLVCFWFYSTGVFKQGFFDTLTEQEMSERKMVTCLSTIVVWLTSILPANDLSGFAYDTK